MPTNSIDPTATTTVTDTSHVDGGRTYGGRSVIDRQADRRRRFLDAALAEFGESGYAASSVTSICKAAGLSRRQFYEIFDDRESLLMAAYDEIQSAARTAVIEALAGVESTDRKDLATAAMRAYVESVAVDPRRAEVSFVQIVGVSPVVEQHRLDVRDEWTTYFVAAMAQFTGREAAPRMRSLGTAFVGALTAVIHEWSFSAAAGASDSTSAQLEAIVELLADMLVAFAEM